MKHAAKTGRTKLKVSIDSNKIVDLLGKIEKLAIDGDMTGKALKVISKELSENLAVFDATHPSDSRVVVKFDVDKVRGIENGLSLAGWLMKKDKTYTVTITEKIITNLS